MSHVIAVGNVVAGVITIVIALGLAFDLIEIRWKR